MPGTLTVYYNGACPICGAEIAHYRRLATSAPLAWIDVSAEPSALDRFGIDAAGAERRLHAIAAEGDLLTGVDAFTALWRRLPRYRWLASLVGTPLVRPLAVALYERVLAPGLVWWNRRRRMADA
ncbi:MAG: DUF393 domain-containing protein [Pseudomonadota bacterium]